MNKLSDKVAEICGKEKEAISPSNELTEPLNPPSELEVPVESLNKSMNSTQGLSVSNKSDIKAD